MTDLAKAARRLADLVEYDMNGTSGKGGNGGLMSDETLRAACEVHAILNRKTPDAAEAPNISLWLPEPDLFCRQALGKLLEEMGEAAAIAARCLIQGIGESDPKTGEPNRQALARELADASAAIRFVQVITMIDRMPERAEAKFAGYSHWVDLMVEHQLALETEKDMEAAS